MTKNLKNKFSVLFATIFFGVNIFSVSASTSRISFNLTDAQKEFIQKSKTVTVALSPDNYPYSSINENGITGIFPELISLISYETGLKFKIIPCKTYSEYTEIKKNQSADIVFATHVTDGDALSSGYRITSPYMAIPYAKVELKKDSASHSFVAVLESPSAEAYNAAKYYYSDQIIYCNSMARCFEHLRSFNCESVIVNSYQAEYLQYIDIKNQYVVKELYDNLVEISAAVNLKCDKMLFDIISQTLTSITDLTKEEIINRNTQQLERESSLFDLIYTQPTLVIIVLLFIFALVIVIFILIDQMKQVSNEQKASDMYKRFMTYVCTAVDAVTELNVRDRKMIRFKIENGHLIEQHVNYQTDEWLMFHEDDRDEIKKRFSNENLLEMCEKETSIHVECRMKWGDSKEYRWCNCTLRGIPISKNNPLNLLLFIQDNQELKLNDEKQRKALEDAFEMANQASHAKGTFLSKMSHEIRTPLNAVIGYLSIAKDSDNSPEKIQHCIDNSEIAAKHLLSIINDVLDISSIESGKMKIAHEDFDLKKLITDLTTVFFQNAKTKGIRFDANVEGLTDEWVVGDNLRLNQILMNLLSNAIKFTPKDGQVKLLIEQKEIKDEQVYFQFTVKDTGIGMSSEYMTRLFKPFEQESATTVQKYGGTGLGLSITYNLITMMGGNIEVQSVQGEGSTFVVTMHFAISKDHANKKLVSMDYSHVRALVVDDVKDDGSYIKTLLKRCGVKADFVVGGDAALKRLRIRKDTEYAYNLCILDWNMPEMNGIDTAKEIRKIFGDEMPIIIATAYDVSELDDVAKSAGVNKVIAKPLFQSTLFDLLVSTFGKYNPDTQIDEHRKLVNMTGVHVLLAEDNVMNMEIAVTVLEKAGVKVDQVTDGQQAYDKFVSMPAETYDLILMDIQMPVLNGYEATKKIRKSNHPEAKTIPIVAMTANAFAEDVAEALSKGMNAHIAKPINYDKLFDVLDKFSK